MGMVAAVAVAEAEAAEAEAVAEAAMVAVRGVADWAEVVEEGEAPVVRGEGATAQPD